MLVLNKRSLPIPTEWRETTEQDVSDYTSCPDVHLEAISERVSDVRVSKVRPGQITGHGKINDSSIINQNPNQTKFKKPTTNTKPQPTGLTEFKKRIIIKRKGYLRHMTKNENAHLHI